MPLAQRLTLRRQACNPRELGAEKVKPKAPLSFRKEGEEALHVAEGSLTASRKGEVCIPCRYCLTEANDSKVPCECGVPATAELPGLHGKDRQPYVAIPRP